jgi:hypothetical protein
MHRNKHLKFHLHNWSQSLTQRHAKFETQNETHSITHTKRHTRLLTQLDRQYYTNILLVK